MEHVPVYPRKRSPLPARARKASTPIRENFDYSIRPVASPPLRIPQDLSSVLRTPSPLSGPFFRQKSKTKSARPGDPGSSFLMPTFPTSTVRGPSSSTFAHDHGPDDLSLLMDTTIGNDADAEMPLMKDEETAYDGWGGMVFPGEKHEMDEMSDIGDGTIDGPEPKLPVSRKLAKLPKKSLKADHGFPPSPVTLPAPEEPNQTKVQTKEYSPEGKLVRSAVWEAYPSWQGHTPPLPEVVPSRTGSRVGRASGAAEHGERTKSEIDETDEKGMHGTSEETRALPYHMGDVEQDGDRNKDSTDDARKPSRHMSIGYPADLSPDVHGDEGQTSLRALDARCPSVSRLNHVPHPSSPQDPISSSDPRSGNTSPAADLTDEMPPSSSSYLDADSTLDMVTISPSLSDLLDLNHVGIGGQEGQGDEENLMADRSMFSGMGIRETDFAELPDGPMHGSMFGSTKNLASKNYPAFLTPTAGRDVVTPKRAVPLGKSRSESSDTLRPFEALVRYENAAAGQTGMSRHPSGSSPTLSKSGESRRNDEDSAMDPQRDPGSWRRASKTGQEGNADSDGMMYRRLGQTAPTNAVLRLPSRLPARMETPKSEPVGPSSRRADRDPKILMPTAIRAKQMALAEQLEFQAIRARHRTENSSVRAESPWSNGSVMSDLVPIPDDPHSPSGSSRLYSAEHAQHRERIRGNIFDELPPFPTAHHDLPYVDRTVDGRPQSVAASLDPRDATYWPHSYAVNGCAEMQSPQQGIATTDTINLEQVLPLELETRPGSAEMDEMLKSLSSSFLEGVDVTIKQVSADGKTRKFNLGTCKSADARKAGFAKEMGGSSLVGVILALALACICAMRLSNAALESRVTALTADINRHTRQAFLLEYALHELSEWEVDGEAWVDKLLHTDGYRSEVLEGIAAEGGGPRDVLAKYFSDLGHGETHPQLSCGECPAADTFPDGMDQSTRLERPVETGVEESILSEIADMIAGTEVRELKLEERFEWYETVVQNSDSSILEVDEDHAKGQVWWHFVGQREALTRWTDQTGVKALLDWLRGFSEQSHELVAEES